MAGRTGYSHGTFSWVDLSTTDLAASQKFYTDVFGWEAKEMPTDSGQPYVMFFHEGKKVAAVMPISEDETKHGVPPHWNHYINVDNISASVEKAEKLGAKVFCPPMDIMTAGKLAVIADPEGAIVGFWEKGEHFGAEWVNHPGGFCWNELATRDVEGAKGFYGELFGWTFKNTESPDDYFEIRNSEDWLNGAFLPMSEEWPKEVPAHWNVYFSVTDIEATKAKVEAGGGKIVVPLMEVEVGKFIMFADPHGAHFYAIQQNIVDD